MKIKRWKILVYGMMALGLIILYYYFNNLALFAFAPVGFLIYLIESLPGLRKITVWKQLVRKEKTDLILSIFTLVIIAAIIVLIAVEFLPKLL